MAHEAAALCSRLDIPLLHVALAALALLHLGKVEEDGHVAILGSRLAARLAADEQELERGAVGDGGEHLCAHLDAEVELVPVLAKVGRVRDVVGDVLVVDHDEDRALVAKLVLVCVARDHLPRPAGIGAEEGVALVVVLEAAADGADAHDKAGRKRRVELSDIGLARDGPEVEGAVFGVARVAVDALALVVLGGWFERLPAAAIVKGDDGADGGVCVLLHVGNADAVDLDEMLKVDEALGRPPCAAEALYKLGAVLSLVKRTPVLS